LATNDVSAGAEAAETVKQRMAERYQQIDAALRDQAAAIRACPAWRPR
jgi:hypothetical protein